MPVAPSLLVGYHNDVATGRRFEIYYEAAASKVQRQDAWNRDLESKAARYSGAAVAVVGLTIAIVQRRPETSSTFTEWQICIAAVGAVCFLATVVSTLLVLRSQDFRNTPNLTKFSELLDDKKGEDKDTWLRWAGDEYRNAYEHNRSVLDKKGRVIVACEVSTALTLIISLFVATVAVFGF